MKNRIVLAIIISLATWALISGIAYGATLKANSTNAVVVTTTSAVVNTTTAVTAPIITTTASVTTSTATGVTTTTSSTIASTATTTTTIAKTTTTTTATTTTPTVAAVSYAASIQPVFNQFCVRCHSSGSINLSSYSGTLKLVVPGNAAGSALYNSVATGSMSREGMTAAQKQALADWINQGAHNN